MKLLQTTLPGLPEADPETADKVSSLAKDIEQIKSLSFGDLINRMAEGMVNFAINLTIAIIVFYVGRFVIHKIYKLCETIFTRRRIDRSLTTFVLSLVNIVLYFILIVTVVGILGIETTSFLAIFASAGVAIGMALSGTLQNFAGGVLILLLKPYKIGDYIEAQGYAGTVREIQIFFTILTTPDNKSISIPNGGLSTGSVNNWSRESYRRVSWTVSVSYGDDIEPIREAVLEMFKNDERIVKGEEPTYRILEVAGTRLPEETGDETSVPLDGASPTQGDDLPAVSHMNKKRGLFARLFRKKAISGTKLSRLERLRRGQPVPLPKPDRSPKVFVQELAASSVDLQIRAWTRTDAYWDVFYDYNERFYRELPLSGANFPFPQLDVHLTRNA